LEMRRKHGFFALAVSYCAVIAFSAQPDAANRGRETFEKRCVGCHSLDNNKVGPSLRNVFGRRAGADARFTYSDALKKAPFSWSDATLDKWLADPDSLVPENDMAFRMDNAAERAAIIDYLKQLSGKP